MRIVAKATLTSHPSDRTPASTAAAAMGLALALGLALACGSKPPPKSAEDVPSNALEAGVEPIGDGSAGGGAAMCSGSDLDLANVLGQSACEVPNAASDAKRRDVSALLEVKASASAMSVSPGGHIEIIVAYVNKSSAALPLDFVLDPTARFTVETYTSTNRRAELPKTSPPHGRGDPVAQDASPNTATAEVIVPPGGKATVKIPWDAVRLKWAPELLKGTPPEQGYPTSPAGPLPKGKYLLKIITPLTGVFEGSDHEVSTTKLNITVQ